MDGFEVRLNLINVLRRLTSSQSSINTAVRFLMKYRSRCGGDLWQCLMEECEKVGLNGRVNILYLLDSLLVASTEPSNRLGEPTSFSYVVAVRRDLPQLVDVVVPASREGLLNLSSTRQILHSWRTKRLLDESLLDSILEHLAEREAVMIQSAAPLLETRPTARFSKRDVLERINDDRERHKRLREQIWVLPVPAIQSLQERGSTVPTALAGMHRLAICMPFALATFENDPVGAEGPLDAECEQLWAANVSDGNGQPLELDDWAAMRLERLRYVGSAQS